MKLTARLLSTLVLAALAAALVQADARERGARHGAHPARPAGQFHPAAARGASAPPSTSSAAHTVNPLSFFVPGPPGNPAKHLTHRPGALEALKKSAARPASVPRFARRAPEPAPPFAARNAIGLAARPAGAGVFSGSVKANAIAAHPGVSASIPVAPVGFARLGTGPANAVHPALPATSASGGTINGTGMTRPGLVPGVLGGPAKIAAGISGTGLKSRAH